MKISSSKDAKKLVEQLHTKISKVIDEFLKKIDHDDGIKYIIAQRSLNKSLVTTSRMLYMASLTEEEYVEALMELVRKESEGL